MGLLIVRVNIRRRRWCYRCWCRRRMAFIRHAGKALFSNVFFEKTSSVPFSGRRRPLSSSRTTLTTLLLSHHHRVRRGTQSAFERASSSNTTTMSSSEKSNDNDTNNRKNVVLVTGSTGRVGKEVLSLL